MTRALSGFLVGRRLAAPAVAATFGLLSFALGVPGAAPAAAATATATAHYSLPLALQESLYFYDAQKSGPARSLGDQPLDWRGDSEPSDSCVPLQPMSNNVGTNMSAAFISANKAALDPDGNGCVDVSGGFHDAGDHAKFGLPQSYAASTVGWGMYEFPDAYQATGTWAHGLDEMKWFSDYFMRSTFMNSSGSVVAFAYQVGEGSVDHDYWGPSELQSPTQYPRPAYFATSETLASDQTAGAAAALAVESILVKGSDPTYSAKALQYAQALYAFSEKYRGLGYSGGFYNSSYDEDELAWAAAWLDIATGQSSYLNDIVATDSAGKYTGWMNRIIASTDNTWQNAWVMSWDSKWGGVFSLIDPLVQGNSAVPAIVQQQVHYFDKWQVQYWSHVAHDNPSDTNFISDTPAGFAFLTNWGSARYNTAAQLEALAYRHNFSDDPQSVAFSDWAMGQMNYLMGDNPSDFSYIVGFGSTTPYVGSEVGGTATAASHPHHGDAQGSLTNSQTDPPDDRHILWGALVGGPGSDDKPDDVTTDYVLNEVAVDYNAGMVGALAGLYEFYGQSQPMTAFTPPPEPASDSYYTTATMNQDSDQGTQLTVNITNIASDPPHFETDMSARVFFDISSIWAQGQTINDISTPVYYDAAAQIDGNASEISAPVQWGAADSCVYYVSIDWSGDDIGLPPSRAFEFGINAATGPNWKFYWDSSASPSLTGLAAGTYASTPDPHIPVYLNGSLVYGHEPALTADDSCGNGSSSGGDSTPPTAPSNVTVTRSTSNSVSLSWTASSDDVGVAGYDVLRDGAQMGTTTSTSFTDTGLTPDTAYAYTVKAFDAAGNTSAASTAITGTTTAGSDTAPPSAPTGLKVTGTTSSSVSLSWTAATDNVGVTGYQVFRGSTLVASPAATSFTDTGLATSTRYSYTVKAIDAAGNVSTASSAVSATTSSGNTGGGGSGCTATYTNSDDWGNGFTANVTVTNTSTEPTSSWKVTWTFGGNQVVTNYWGATITSSGESVTATNLSYNNAIQPGQQASFGFQASYTGTNAAPSLTCTAS